jgi:F-type H+-transporting ATPase subunit a
LELTKINIDEVFTRLDRIVVFKFNLFGFNVEIGNTIVVSWIVMALIIILAVVFTRNLSVSKPGRLQAIAELFVGTVDSLCRDSMGGHASRFVPYIGTLLLYLGVANIIALFNFIPGIEMYPPTKDINVTGSLAVITICMVLVCGIRYKGVKGWLKSFAEPMALMVPFKIMEYFTKPLSLCLRLFGNIFAGFVIMELIFVALPFIAPPFSAYFDIFDGVLQAFIFVYLTTVYIGEAIEG